MVDDHELRALADQLQCLLTEASEGWLTSHPLTTARTEGAIAALRGVAAGDLAAVVAKLPTGRL